MKKNAHSAWLPAALEYVPSWLGFQIERYRQPGCCVAIARDGRLVAEFALGAADLRTGKSLTPRHRFRIASR